MQYVYTMRRVGKTVPPKRQILKDISLSFFPGAKIGVLGLNGSGKSSLMRIMAGEDPNFDGEAVPMPNMKIGYLRRRNGRRVELTDEGCELLPSVRVGLEKLESAMQQIKHHRRAGPLQITTSSPYESASSGECETMYLGFGTKFAS